METSSFIPPPPPLLPLSALRLKLLPLLHRSFLRLFFCFFVFFSLILLPAVDGWAGTPELGLPVWAELKPGGHFQKVEVRGQQKLLQQQDPGRGSQVDFLLRVWPSDWSSRGFYFLRRGFQAPPSSDLSSDLCVSPRWFR